MVKFSSSVSGTLETWTFGVLSEQMCHSQTYIKALLETQRVHCNLLKVLPNDFSNDAWVVMEIPWLHLQFAWRSCFVSGSISCLRTDLCQIPVFFPLVWGPLEQSIIFLHVVSEPPLLVFHPLVHE